LTTEKKGQKKAEQETERKRLRKEENKSRAHAAITKAASCRREGEVQSKA